MVTVSRLEKTLGDIWAHQNITAPVSWLSLAKHYLKANKIGVVVATTSSTDSKHSPLLSSSAYFKCAVHMTRNVCFLSSFENLFVERFTGLIEDLSFFFEIKERQKCKTYSIDKEETSTCIMILKSFSYNVISKY